MDDDEEITIGEAVPTEGMRTIMVVPDEAKLAKIDKVMRCNACGYDVVPEDGHICQRGGGVLVECHPFGCAIKDCIAARRGTLTQSLSHHAAHLQWHLDNWEKEKPAAALAAAAAAAAPVAAAAPAPTVDRWTGGLQMLPMDGGAIGIVTPPTEHPGAVCVALLFHSSDLGVLTAECWHIGRAPLSAYVSAERPSLAVVPIDGAKPDQGGEIGIFNDGGCNVGIRLGARWELRTDG